MSDELRKYFEGFPEAPVSDSFKWVDAGGLEHMTTIRDWSLSELMKKIELMPGIVANVGGHPVNGKAAGTPAPAPKPDRAAEVVRQGGNAEMATQLQTEADDIGLPPDGKTWITVDCAFVKILPQPDNKVNIEFYGNERKQPHDDYPSVKVTKWSLVNATGLMKHVTSADISKPAEFSLPCRVYYTEGKQYTKPNGEAGHYKDVAHVRPI